MSNINRLSVKEFTSQSLDNGMAKDKHEAWGVIMMKAGESFVNKLNEQKVKLADDENAGALYLSEKNDAVAIKFRGKWFELYVNFELLEAGVDSFVFSLLTDPERIKVYEKFEAKANDKRPVALEYSNPKPEDPTWKDRENRNRKLMN